MLVQKIIRPPFSLREHARTDLGIIDNTRLEIVSLKTQNTKGERVKVKVEVLIGPQGSGKSTIMLDELVAMPGLYVVAAPIKSLIEEHAQGLFDRDRTIPVFAVHEDSPGRGKTTKKLLEAAQSIRDRRLQHAVIVTTHDTLMTADLTGFAGWHARIDEAPSAVQAGRINVGETHDWFVEKFDLRNLEGVEWAEVTRRGAMGNWKRVQQDSLLGSNSEFFKQSAIPGRLYVRATSWSDADIVDWFSLWTPEALRHFASVTIAGSSYTNSVGYKAVRSLFENDIEFVERPVVSIRTGQPTVAIHYFAGEHHGSSSFWESLDGLAALMLVENELTRLMEPTSYWSGNKIVQTRMAHRFSGDLIRPMVAGLNQYRHRTSCAFIYSGKATPNDAALKEVFGLSDGDVRASREDDAINQFALRGAIRNPNYDGPFNIFLYERSQAERLAHYLALIGIENVSVLPIDTPLLTRSRSVTKSEEEPVLPMGRNDRLKRDADRKRAKRAAVARSAGRTPGLVGRPSGACSLDPNGVGL